MRKNQERKNREHLYSPENLDGFAYPKVEQDGDNNFYKFHGRDKVTGELITMLGTDKEINAKIGKEIITHSNETNKTIESKEGSIELIVSQFADRIEKSYINGRSKKPLRRILPLYYKAEQVPTLALWYKENFSDIKKMTIFEAALKEQLRGRGIAIEEYTVNGSYINELDFNKPDSGFSVVTLHVKAFGTDQIKEQFIEETSQKSADSLIEIYQELIATMPDKNKSIDISGDKKGWSVIEAYLSPITNARQSDDFELLFDTLLSKLQQAGYGTSRVALSYFHRHMFYYGKTTRSYPMSGLKIWKLPDQEK